VSGGGEVLVVWTQRGSFIAGGVAYARAAGEQDMMPPGKAKALAVCGMVRLLMDTSVPVVIAGCEEEEDAGY